MLSRSNKTKIGNRRNTSGQILARPQDRSHPGKLLLSRSNKTKIGNRRNTSGQIRVRPIRSLMPDDEV